MPSKKKSLLTPSVRKRNRVFSNDEQDEDTGGRSKRESDEEYQTPEQKRSAHWAATRKASRLQSRLRSHDIRYRPISPPPINDSHASNKEHLPRQSSRAQTRVRSRDIHSTSIRPPPFSDSDDSQDAHPSRQSSRQNPSTSTKPPSLSSDSDGSEENDPSYETGGRRHARRSTNRLRNLRDRHLHEMIDTDSSDEEDDIDEPVVVLKENAPHLGDANCKPNIWCRWCGAVHFRSIPPKKKRGARNQKDVIQNEDGFGDPKDHTCCSNGKVFIPPMRKQPDEIIEIMNNRRTKQDIISYNTCFSFASLQYHKVPAAPFGQPVAKTLGPIRHFPSAALPNNPNNPRFGNYYLYKGDQAVNLRMEGFNHLDREVVQKLERAMERCHPFAHTLRTMGEVLKEVQRSDEFEELVRLKIVDARNVKPEFLHGQHPGLYREPLECGEHVALFYSATIEQDITLPGLNIYPKKNDKTPMPLFPSDPRINCFCYPLLMPFGEVGWKYKGFLLATDPRVPYVERLKKFAEESPSIAANWELPISPEELLQHQLHYTAYDPNLEDSTVESDIGDDDTEDDDELDRLRHDLESYVATGETEHSEIEERDGEFYPIIRSSTNNEEQESDEEMPEDPNPDIVAELNAETFRSSTLLRVDLSGDLEDDNIPIEDIEADVIDAIDHEEYPIRENDTPHVPNEDEVSASDLDERNSLIDDEAVEYTAEPSTSEAPPQHTADQIEHQNRKYVSPRQWGLFVHQQRKILQSDRHCVRNRFSAAGKLGQVFLLDLCTRMNQMRHGYQRQYHTEFMTSTRQKFLAALQRRADRFHRTIGCVSSVPASVPGSPRHMQRLFEQTVAMSRAQRGKPDFFITFTCNVNWPEIKNNLLPGETWVDRPFLVCEVFLKKLKEFLNKIIGKRYEEGRVARKKGLFGYVRWFSYSIEFQQRGPPHAHIVMSLKKHIKTAAQIDKVCQAVLPPDDGTEETRELRELVESFMIHRPCEGDAECYCRQGLSPNKKECRKHFPKEFSYTTKFGDRSYPELRRPDDNEFCMIGDRKADNRYVVPYNKQLLTTFRCHINVEVVSNLSVVKYIFKYIFKGYDRVLIEAITSLTAPSVANMTLEGHLIYPKNLKIPPGAKKLRELEAQRMLRRNGVRTEDDHGNAVLVYDEYTMVEDARAITSCEAAWEFMAYPRHGMSHTVVDLFVHGPEQEPLFYKKEEQETVEQRLRENPEIITRFKEWFSLNQRDPEARMLTYEELPRNYVFKDHKWRKRGNHRELLFGRIKSVHPRNREVFAIRLLCTVQKGCRSFEELRTVNGILHPTFVSAAMALGLMNTQDEWDRCLEEASAERVPVTMRRMFASILIFNPVKDPLQLWERHKMAFYERKSSWTDEEKEAHALFHIESFLRAHYYSLKDFNLPDIDILSLPSRRDLIDDSGMNEISTQEAEKEMKKYCEGMNEDQQDIFNKVMDSVINPAHNKAIFVQGSGGTGKTRLMTALYYSLTAKGHKVACVAHTGIAARLLPFGSTAHRQFHIPLATEENMTCNVDQRSEEATRLSHIDVVIWDEATMTDRRILNAVHLLMAQLHPENEALPFAGVKFVFCGDWKQTLPIVPEARGAGAVNYTMKGSELWNENKLEVLFLEKNMRARYDQDFANWIANVGIGRININQERRPEDQLVKLDYGQIVDSEGALIEAVFGDLSVPPANLETTFKSSAILAVDNNTTFDINQRALNRMQGEEYIFLSIDEHLPERKPVEPRRTRGTSVEQPPPRRAFAYLDPEAYHPETPPGMPPHRLALKIGAPIILLKNISTTLGLVNGTRMVVDEIGETIIWARPLNPTKRTPNRLPFTRCHFAPINVLRRERCFQRTQFPFRLAFSMTCNRAQGQTLDKVGLLLRTPCFSHGQFYVAVSRVRRSTDLYIYNAQAVTQLESQDKWKESVLKEEIAARQNEKINHREEDKKKTQRLRNERRSLRKLTTKSQQQNTEGDASAADDSVPYVPYYNKDPIWFGPEDKGIRFYTNNVVFRNAL